MRDGVISLIPGLFGLRRIIRYTFTQRPVALFCFLSTTTCQLGVALIACNRFKFIGTCFLAITLTGQGLPPALPLVCLLGVLV